MELGLKIITASCWASVVIYRKYSYVMQPRGFASIHEYFYVIFNGEAGRGKEVED